MTGHRKRLRVRWRQSAAVRWPQHELGSATIVGLGFSVSNLTWWHEPGGWRGVPTLACFGLVLRTPYRFARHSRVDHGISCRPQVRFETRSHGGLVCLRTCINHFQAATVRQLSSLAVASCCTSAQQLLSATGTNTETTSDVCRCWG